VTGTSQEDGLAPISSERGRVDQSGLDARLKEPAVPVSMGSANELACILAANDLLDRFLHFLKRQPVTARGQRIAIFAIFLVLGRIPVAGLHARDQFGRDVIPFDGKRMICVVSVNPSTKVRLLFLFLGRPGAFGKTPITGARNDSHNACIRLTMGAASGASGSIIIFLFTSVF
jgi:hypothetical protein